MVSKQDKDKKIQPSQNKSYYNVTVEGIVPVTVVYRVYAENPEDAYRMVKTAPWQNLAGNPVPKMNRLKSMKSVIKKWGTAMIELMVNG